MVARGRACRPRAAWPACLAIALLLGAAVACSGSPASPREAETLTVGAAADLQAAFSELGPRFESATGGKLVFSFGSSGVLAQQIENGAPIDLFASADEEYVTALVAKNRALADTAQPYALGRLALVISRQGSPPVSKLADLAEPSVIRIAIANPEHAPYGVAARQALMASGLWDPVSPKIVYGENVRQALQFVQTGNAEAGIVALSIADVPEVTWSAVDDSLYQPLRQTIVVVRGTRHEQLAREFISFVSGPSSRAVLDKYGFLPPVER